MFLLAVFLGSGMTVFSDLFMDLFREHVGDVRYYSQGVLVGTWRSFGMCVGGILGRC